ncbi:chloroplast signal recognition particle component [Perilla frutescens var. hirtella]|uniref:Chloroplast signal recognition particle component n=1 Tax=Perilla frutescens var. hirtella TaxID=608512 RepID=A0AAD4NXU6_PERFH|nr:chloroplast signal recognition particle component [Perilla frutescens var. hirtella]
MSLHMVTGYARLGVAKVLIEYSADVEMADDWGLTPLQLVREILKSTPQLQFARRLGLESVVKAFDGAAYEFAEVEILEMRGIGPALLTSHVNLGKWGGCFELFSYMIRDGSFRAEESTLVSVLSACTCTYLAVLDWESTVAISCGLASHGHGEGALSIFEQILGEGLRSDDVVVGVLSACTCSDAEEGMEYSERMGAEHRINQTIQQYGCLVDQMG